ncbi:MAG: peptidoglycan DD-metalloendopeptidase family protein [Myxococcales bacterium]|nr:peptidoglycan DD-metalloendopeptidase family protein [Myxococcales bacterium]
MKTRAACLALAPLIWAASGFAADNAHPVQEDLSEVKRDLERERRLLQELERESGSALRVVSRIEEDLARAEREEKEARAELARLEQDLEEHRAQRDRAEAERRKTQERLRQRLRSLYRLGELGWLRLLFSAESLSDTMWRYRLAWQMARNDRRLAQDLARRSAELIHADERIAARQNEVRGAAAAVARQREAALRARREKVELLRLVRNREALHRQALRDLTAAQQRLQEVMQGLSGQPGAGRGFATWKGRLPPPLEGARVKVPFGRIVEERFKTITLHPGVDITAPRGTPVRAIYPGRVAFADRFAGYGLLCILDHGGSYFSLYAHLDELKVRAGDTLKQGQVLGAVGETGSLEGPMLYFEIRQGERAVNPEEWVRFSR